MVLFNEKNRGFSGLLVIVVMIVSLCVWGCDNSDFTVHEEDDGEVLSAVIRTTSYGVPHIKADNLKSLAFGQGYVFAKNYCCELADQIVKVRSERAAYFGPGDNDYNINSDFFYKAIKVYAYAQERYPGLSQDSKEVIKGYVAGYNKYLEDVGKSGVPASCRGAEWVKPIDEIDLVAYYLNLAIFASARQLYDFVLAATPDDGAAKRQTDIPFPDFNSLGTFSNAYAIGRDMTEHGRGALLANPHFPHTGTMRFYEMHLTIPGQLNASGASLLGVPLVQIGFNENVAWAHTVSSARRFSIYKLTLAEGSRTAYQYDGQIRQMEQNTYTIRVKQTDGSYLTKTRTFYRSHYGLMIEHPLMKWSDQHAFCFKDANEGNMDMIDQWLAMNRARNMEEFKQSFKDYYGIPWVNVIAADDQGNTFYIDPSSVPYLSNEAWEYFRNSPESQLFLNLGGLYLFPGNSSIFEWQGTIGPGLVPYEKAPKLERVDYVANMNNPPWLTNLNQLITGYAPIYGAERGELSLRARIGLLKLQNIGGTDRRVSAADLENAFFDHRSLLADLILDDLVARCQAKGNEPIMLDSGQPEVDISQACNALANWNGRFDLDSIGAHVFKEFADFFNSAPTSKFAVPFDPNAPLHTPNTLAPPPAEGEDPVLQYLAQAVSDLKKAGVPLYARLGEVQFVKKGDEKIPTPGGNFAVGTFGISDYVPMTNRRMMNDTLMPVPDITGTLINEYTGLHTEGYLINYGDSFVYALEFTDHGPKARGLITYSASNDPSSPHFSDQTRLFSEKKLRPMLFTENEIMSDPNLTVQTITKTIN